MNPCRVLAVLGLTYSLALLGCGDHAAPRIPAAAATQSSAPVALAPEVDAALDDLERDTIASSATECGHGLAALANSTDPPDESLELACELALAGAPEPARTQLELQFRSLVDSELTLELALEAVAGGDPHALLELALQLEQRAGNPADPFVALHTDTFNAARVAVARAAKSGLAEATAELERLEAREFPLAGVREEPLWRALYFRRFEQIQDTMATRRHVAGLANALATLCQQWEPPGIRSVAFDTGLETYLAPVRAQVPGRLVGTAPKVAETVATAVGKASEGATERSFEGWIEQGVRAYQDVKRDVQGALAVGSVVGRDTAQALFDKAPGCRSPRGLKLIASLIRYFEYSRESRPIDAPSAQRRLAKDERRLDAAQEK